MPSWYCRNDLVLFVGVQVWRGVLYVRHTPPPPLWERRGTAKLLLNQTTFFKPSHKELLITFQTLQFCMCFATIMSPHLVAACQSLIHTLFWSLFILMSNSTDILSCCCFSPLSPVTLFFSFLLHALHVQLILTTGELYLSVFLYQTLTCRSVP